MYPPPLFPALVRLPSTRRGVLRSVGFVSRALEASRWFGSARRFEAEVNLEKIHRLRQLIEVTRAWLQRIQFRGSWRKLALVSENHIWQYYEFASSHWVLPAGLVLQTTRNSLLGIWLCECCLTGGLGAKFGWMEVE